MIFNYFNKILKSLKTLLGNIKLINNKYKLSFTKNFITPILWLNIKQYEIHKTNYNKERNSE